MELVLEQIHKTGRHKIELKTLFQNEVVELDASFANVNGGNEFFSLSDLYDQQAIDILKCKQYELKTRSNLINLKFNKYDFVEISVERFISTKKQSVAYDLQAHKCDALYFDFKVTQYSNVAQGIIQKIKAETLTKQNIDKLVADYKVTRADLAIQNGFNENVINQYSTKRQKKPDKQRIRSTKAGCREVII